jgi:hypothetical protein
MIRQAYLDAAAVAVGLLADPAVSGSWEQASALQGFAVSGLAGHLARQITRVPPTVAQEAPVEPPISLLEHYGRSRWVNTDLDSDINVRIRYEGDQEATSGAAALAARARAALDGLPEALLAQPADRVVHLPWGPWSLVLDDFLTTRLLEITVHCDDLAVSVGVDTPPMPPSVLDPVFDLLCRLAARRHGATAVLRALSRAERAPATISAF